MIADPWVVSSALQKSIRRGDIETAQRVALTLLTQKGSALWRRLMVIAFEDMGVGSAETLASAVAATAAPNSRKANGGDVQIARDAARMLVQAPKDRSADHLICGAKDHPSLEMTRTEGFVFFVGGRRSGHRGCDRGSRHVLRLLRFRILRPPLSWYYRRKLHLDNTVSDSTAARR